MSERNSKREKHNPWHVIRNVWFMFRYTFLYAPGYIWVTLTEAFGRGFYHILSVLFVKYLFDAIEKGAAFQKVLCMSLLVAAYNGLFELFNRWMLNVYRPKATLALHEGMQKELYKKANELDQECYDNPEFYNDFVWAIRESDNRTATMMNDLSLFLNRIVSSIVIFGVLITMDWIVAVFLAVTIVLGFRIKMKLNRLNYEKSVELNPINRKCDYTGRVFYLPDYAKEIRQGKIGERMREQYDETIEEKINCIKKYSIKITNLSFLSSLLTKSGPHVIIVVYLMIRYVLDSSLTLGSFSASINASMKLYWTIDDIGNYLTKFNEHSLYVERFRKFLTYESKIKGEKEDVPAFETLTLQNLYFTYPFTENCNPEAAVLKEINLEIKKGEKIAFVGYNGAGKTTLIKLLMRLYDPTQGRILYNGQDIREFAPPAYRSHIGAVFQDYKVFAATVAENVLGREYETQDEERVLEALRAVAFEEKLASMPKGIHSQLTREFSKDGIGLSGGESQKIAIARVFAQSHEILIMDEPSSALDPLSEYQLNQSILKSAANKTVIFISHRLSTTRIADRIYMFDNGAVAECGSHEELMEQNGKYAEMYRIQAKKYRT